MKTKTRIIDEDGDAYNAGGKIMTSRKNDGDDLGWLTNVFASSLAFCFHSVIHNSAHRLQLFVAVKTFTHMRRYSCIFMYTKKFSNALL